MRKITIVETFDKVRHDTEEQARRHLDRLYGDCITDIVRQVRMTNFTLACEWLDQNTAKLERLLQIKQDMQPGSEENEE